LYKAHAFLASGSGVDGFRAPSIIYAPAKSQIWRRGLAFVVAALMTLGVGVMFGLTLDQQPALLAAGAVVAIALTQLLLQADSLHGRAGFLLRALGLSLMVCTVYFALHHLFELGLAGSVLPVRETGGAFETVLVLLIMVVFAGLLILQQAFKSGRSPLLQTIYVHLYNGLYIDVYITRVLERVWPAPLAAAK
jgi:NAD(P)H-quinone oxidoreductase subunit 5